VKPLGQTLKETLDLAAAVNEHEARSVVEGI
jgi:hypothetical protein